MTVPRVSSALKAVDLKQVPAPLIIGERINTQGSRKAKKLVLDDDYDGLVDLGRIQVEDGAHCLDVCVATTERADEREFMLNLVKRLSLEIDAPLVIDSTDPEVIEASVTQIPGRPIINSINLEGNGDRFEKLAPIMAKYGLPAIALCIGPEGMAKTSQQKVDTAELLYETGKKHGLKIEQFIFDVLTFTLATGEDEFLDAGKNTLEGIKLVKEKFPNSFTTLGLSNISFGLAPYARKILNSVFLYHAVKSGLDSAIVNAKEIIPYGEIDTKEKKLAEDLIFNTNSDALSNLISYFENVGPQDNVSSKKVDVDPLWPGGKRANFRIVNRLKDGIQNDVVSAIAEKLGNDEQIQNIEGDLSLDLPKEVTHDSAIKTLNEDLLPAMKEVGDKFGAGELILPFVLKSAECMKAAVGELEKYLVKEEGTSKGILVLGTVYGDVHDIGKNLVKTIFQNNGYTVHDLGKQVPLQKLCDEKGILLIFDEIQAGLGRTGRLWACDHWNTAPDILCLAKGIAGGVPMGATLVRPDILAAINKGEHSSTFGGNPISCAAGTAALKALTEDGLIENSEKMGKKFKEGLEELKEKHTMIREIRGKGLMIGIEMKFEVRDILMGLIKKGVLMLYSGRNILRILPPLVISEEDVTKVLHALDSILTEEEQKRNAQG